MVNINITQEVFQDLLSMNIPETCGFITGKENNFTNLYLAENKDKRKDRFKICFIDKLIIILKMLKLKHNQYILYHVHSNSLMMSENDIKYARKNSYNIIVANGIAKCWKVIKCDNSKITVNIGMNILR